MTETFDSPDRICVANGARLRECRCCLCRESPANDNDNNCIDAKQVEPEKTELMRFMEASPELLRHTADALSREFVGEHATPQTLAAIEHGLKTALETAYRERYGACVDTTGLAVELDPVSGIITLAFKE